MKLGLVVRLQNRIISFGFSLRELRYWLCLVDAEWVFVCVCFHSSRNHAQSVYFYLFLGSHAHCRWVFFKHYPFKPQHFISRETMSALSVS